ncbi:M3 family metallopeptidase [Undibacterium curvum]|uniref:M3 family metallopeptidase n=1 Tax=Undibacterium curvum TaxID=2762294 RepID=UPI003D137FA0
MKQAYPLLDQSDLTRFQDIRAEQVTPSIAELLSQARAVVVRLSSASEAPDWEHFVQPLEEATEKLGRAWSVVGHLNAVADTPEMRAAYNDNQAAVTEFWTELGQNLALFERYKALQASPDFSSYSQARKTIVEHAIRDFRLSGAELADDKKQRYAEIQEQQAALTTRFSENVLDATNDFSLWVESEQELSGLPQDVIHAAKAAAEKDGKSGYKFTLHFPSYYPLLQYAENRSLREQIYRANATKASELGANPDWDNSAIMRELLALRREEAQLLGYAHFAEVSLVSKMADSPAQVISFLEDLAQRARPFAEQDLQELRQFAQEQCGLTELQAWDVAYVSEKLREQRYAFSEQEVKQYFPEHKIVAGLFRVIQTLFSVSILPDQAPTWHPDVKFFRIEKDGQLLGQFYLDLYARSGKRGGAWMDDARGRRRIGERIQTPVAYLVCNFSEPLNINGVARPALFTHDEVITLFHEFGHGLHHMLTQVEDLSVSGISGVEWDAVELPSQFMENFCWEWDVLQEMTAHIDTGEMLPRALYDKMIAAKNFQSGLQTLRQVEFSLMDMRLHSEFDPADSSTSIQDVVDAVRRQVAVLMPPVFNRMQHSFSHIFAGGYAAGYYSYKWAEVLSADAYAAFEETAAQEGSSLSAATGERFRREILEVGGSRPALESFQAFRGRAPAIDALLRHSGMAA